MTRTSDAELRPKSDEFTFSSVVSYHNTAAAQGSGKARRHTVLRGWHAPLVALGAALLLGACSAETAPAPKTERPVQVQRVTFETNDTAREFVGVVRARHETDLAFRVAGKIVTRVVNVGDHVRAGAIIAQLDPEDLRLQVESAEAELAAATSNLAQ